ncbi:MAG: CAP domain-containing protein, partial [Firmicutes bacterium]|nr:CAP domain-containing protein [Bacillota bacterium]
AVILLMLPSNVLANAANASPSNVRIIYPDYKTAGEGEILLGVRGKYIADAERALERINELRFEACQEGVPHPETRRPLTPSDYVPIKWSSDLEYIARIRAAEASLTMSHIRTDGDSCMNLYSPNGISSCGEVIAWNQTDGMLRGIEQWYEEKSAWVNNVPNFETGHYVQLIDPANRYVGLGCFYSSDRKYENTTTAEFYNRRKVLDESRAAPVQDCIQVLKFFDCDMGNIKIVSDSNNVFHATVGGTIRKRRHTDGFDEFIDVDTLYVMNPKWTLMNKDVATLTKIDDFFEKIEVKDCKAAIVTAAMGWRIANTRISGIHHWGELTIDKKPTCTEMGIQSYHCTGAGCDAQKSISSIHKLGHKFVEKKVSAKIGVAGKTYSECARCGIRKNEKTVPPLIPKTTIIKKLSASKRALKVYWEKKSYTGYQIRYSQKSSMKSAKTVTITKHTTTSRLIKNLESKKKYYVQIRTYKKVGGKNYYSSWSKKMSLKVK